MYAIENLFIYLAIGCCILVQIILWIFRKCVDRAANIKNKEFIDKQQDYIRRTNEEILKKKHDFHFEQERLFQQEKEKLESIQREHQRFNEEKRRQELAALRAETNKLDRQYREILMFKKLHNCLLENSFIYRMTAIDDTLIDKSRYKRAICENISLASPVFIEASVTGQSGKTYRTSLYSCTCKDFQARKIPCKHMIFLASELGLLSPYPDNPKQDLLDVEKSINAHYVEQYDAIYRKCQQKYQEIQQLVNAKSTRYPWLADRIAEYNYICNTSIEEALRQKQLPAIKAADTVKAIKNENRDLLKKSKMLEYQLACYESLFPWLEDYAEDSPTEAFDRIYEIQESGCTEYNQLRDWLSPDEYQKMSSTKKYQLALDRYKARKKSKWQIGIEFERYVGYQYECKGYSVTYQGALMGLEDMGRDLIADNGGECLVIQCKRWAKEKVIHEKHIFQLYGSVVLLSLQKPRISNRGVFITTTSLSPLAKECAKFLNIEVHENVPMRDYPMIKCNVSKNGEKIYHLPMDLQYDKIVITPSKGECYAETVAQAEKLGFRRAYRWNGN